MKRTNQNSAARPSSPSIFSVTIVSNLVTACVFEFPSSVVSTLTDFATTQTNWTKEKKTKSVVTLLLIILMNKKMGR